MGLRPVMCQAGDQAYCAAGEVFPTEAACVRPANAWPTRRAAGLALGALKLPEICCAEFACGADALEAATPSAVESGDPVTWAAVRGDAAADGNAAGLAALAGVTTGFAPVPEEFGVLSAVSVWLMSISCSRLFTLTSWLMYSFGSVFEVGSWFFISVTSSVRKSLAEM